MDENAIADSMGAMLTAEGFELPITFELVVDGECVLVSTREEGKPLDVWHPTRVAGYREPPEIHAYDATGKSHRFVMVGDCARCE